MKFFRVNTYWSIIMILFLMVSGAGCSLGVNPLPKDLPSSLTLRATNRDTAIIYLSWSFSNLNNILEFEVYRKIGTEDYQRIVVLDPDSLNYTDYLCSCIELNKIIYYKLCVSYGDRRLDSNEASAPFLKQGAPARPTSLSANNVSTSYVSLKWTDNSSNEAEFILQRKDGLDGTYLDDIIIPSPYTFDKGETIKCDDTIPGTNTLFHYRVKARNKYGESNYSNEITVKTTGDIGVIID